jgi:peptidoglycan/LPS O-acetylase OafA/YrhL
VVGHRRVEGSRRVPSQHLGDVFSPSSNSLNVLRVALALIVVVDHAIAATSLAYVHLGVVGDATEGTIAVYGFFGISGFLIARSADRRSVGRYAWQRVLRIFPALWVCLIVTAFVFAPLSHSPSSTACDVACLLTLKGGSLGYVLHNAILPASQQGIGRTLQGVAVPAVWNFSVWTIRYELLCYVLVGLLALLAALRRIWIVAAVAAPLWIIGVVFGLTKRLLPSLSVAQVVTLVPVFIAGSLLYLLRDRVIDSGWLALACTAVFAASLFSPFGSWGAALFPVMNGPAMCAPLVAYPVLWLGCHLPFRRLFVRNDYSYGTYVFGGPIEQLLASWGVPHWGLGPYVAVAVVTTLGVAVLSWRFVERPALRLKEARAPVDAARRLAEGLLGRSG